MSVKATIGDIQISGTWEGEAELTCRWRGSSCFWSVDADSMSLEEAIKPEAWEHEHYGRFGNPLAPDPGHSVE